MSELDKPGGVAAPDEADIATTDDTQPVLVADDATDVTDGSEVSKATQETAAPSWETESRAREMGWVPQTEWRGRPEMWRPADEFVRRADEVLPIVKADKRRLEEQARQLREQLDRQQREFDERASRLERMNTVALERQKKQLWDQFESEKLKAVRDGDPEAYQAATRAQHQALAELREQERDLAQPAAVTKPDESESRIAPDVQATVDGWITRNAWFNRDHVMTAAAEAHHRMLLQERPGMSLEDNLADTERMIRETFAAKFGTKPQTSPPRQPHAPPVEGGTRQSGGGNRPKGWSDLPAEAKSAADRNIRDGLFLPKGVTTESASDADIQKARQAYAKAYFED